MVACVPDQRRAGEHYTKVSVKLGFEGFAISECYNTTSFYHFLAISNVGADRHFELRPDSESVWKALAYEQIRYGLGPGGILKAKTK